MPSYIAILEDNSDRVGAMRRCVAEQMPAHELVTFDNADEMIVWLEDHLPQVVLISLDHDLPLVQLRDGARVDAGTGRIVADWIAERTPCCPVLVHTSNEYFAPGMMRVLRDAGWTHRRVYPHDDCAWVATAWIATVKRFLPPLP